MSDLAKRAVACKAWRWRRGTRLLDGRMIVKGQDGHNNNGCVYFVGDRQHTFIRDLDGLPDLDDPGTLGCLEANIEKKYSGPVSVVCERHPAVGEVFLWEVRIPLAFGSRLLGEGVTKKEALVAALEAAC